MQLENSIGSHMLGQWMLPEWNIFQMGGPNKREQFSDRGGEQENIECVAYASQYFPSTQPDTRRQTPIQNNSELSTDFAAIE